MTPLVPCARTMFPFYDDVIAPIIRASAAKRILEIGVRHGATTAQLLERLGPSVELHAVDPIPDFDATELARTFPGRYVLHTDTSHNVLPLLPPVDVALIDGDHNWFTVFHELRLLSEVAREAGTQLPVCILHDVGWPYGRRDLYYAPDRIPAEFRHEHAQRGLHPDRRDFVNGSGGINASMHNAAVEGGRRNGVMTAVDDFIAAYDKPLRTLVLPIYFGLAIVAEEERIARQPELGAVLDWLGSADGKERLLHLSESIRLRGIAHQRNLLSRTQGRYERARTRYLGTLKASLVEHGAGLDEHVQSQLLDRINHGLEVVVREGIAGDLVVDAPALPTSGILMRGYLDAYDILGRTVWVAVVIPVEEVNAAFARYDLLDDNVRVVRSNAPDGSPLATGGPIALLHVAATNASAIRAVLDAQSDHLAPGAVVVVDAEHRVDATLYALEPLDVEAGMWRKAKAPTSGPEPPERPVATVSPVTAREGSVALSVVVVAYDMARELPRTLRSLSPAYQQAIRAEDFEVIVVDNGSPAPFEPTLFADFPGHVRVRRLDPASPSPAHAANVGIDMARGQLVGLLIDGARMASPGLLAHAMQAARVTPRPVITTLAWHLGPVLHMHASEVGYDTAAEDTLLTETDWEADGYRLFDISTIAASSQRGWFGPLGESNALFMPRALWEELGGLDERFVIPGGGRCNHDLYRRACELEDATVIMLVGEGTFHQSHGGAATSGRQKKADADAEYETLRGKPFRPPEADRLYFGGLPESALRTLQHSVRWLTEARSDTKERS